MVYLLQTFDHVFIIHSFDNSILALHLCFAIEMHLNKGPDGFAVNEWIYNFYCISLWHNFQDNLPFFFQNVVGNRAFLSMILYTTLDAAGHKEVFFLAAVKAWYDIRKTLGLRRVDRLPEYRDIKQTIRKMAWKFHLHSASLCVLSLHNEYTQPKGVGQGGQGPATFISL